METGQQEQVTTGAPNGRQLSGRVQSIHKVAIF
jgi:hypothetical protein